MKKSLHTIALLLFIGVGAKAQKQMMFKMVVAPKHDYALLMKMNLNMEMNVTGDTAMINKMKGSGQAFPIVMVMESGTNGDIKTGALNAANKIPFTMTMQTLPSKMTMNGKETPIPMPATNETMFGTYTTDGKMTLDSIAGKKIDDATKAAMIKMIDGMKAAVKFPDTPMKIGDTFTQDTPMDLPISGMASKLNSKTTFKLISIDNNKAYFDLKYELTMDMNGSAMAIKMAGGGDGKMVFDIAASYPTAMQSNMNVNYSMTMPQAATMKMDGKMKMVMDYTTTISGN